MESRFVYPDNIFIPEEYMDEEFEFIPGFNHYMVSNKGRVWSEKSQSFLKPKPMDREGHLGFCLCENGVCHYVYLHRIMAQAFLSNSKHYPIVRHLDDDRDNNDLENLKWGTQKDNHDDAVRNGTYKCFCDEDREKHLCKVRRPITAINIYTNERINFNSISEAANILGLYASNIQKVLNGTRVHTGGYIFE